MKNYMNSKPQKYWWVGMVMSTKFYWLILDLFLCLEFRFNLLRFSRFGFDFVSKKYKRV